MSPYCDTCERPKDAILRPASIALICRVSGDHAEPVPISIPLFERGAATEKWHNAVKVKERDDRCRMRRFLLFATTCLALLGMTQSFGGSEERLEWSCENAEGSNGREVLRLYAGEDPTASLGEVIFDGQRTKAGYIVQGLEHRWVWPIATDAEELSEASDELRFLLRLRPGGITHYFDRSMPKDEDGMITAIMTFMCERSTSSTSSAQLTLSQRPRAQRADEHSAVVITLQCQDYAMPDCVFTYSEATVECKRKGHNGAVLKGVRQPGNLHDFECVN